MLLFPRSRPPQPYLLAKVVSFLLLIASLLLMISSSSSRHVVSTINAATNDDHHRRRRRPRLRSSSSSSSNLLKLSSPRPYPEIFSIEFVTNVTMTMMDEETTTTAATSSSSSFSFSLSSNLKNDNHNMVDGDSVTTNVAVHGKLWYDWTRRAQRIDHGPGSYECVHFYQTQQKCSLIFLEDGMYRLLFDDDDNDNDNYDGHYNESHDKNDYHENDDNAIIDCCLDLPNIGPPPPDWASSTPKSTWRGPVWDDYSQIVATEWWYNNDFVDTDHREKLASASSSSSVLPLESAESTARSRRITIYDFHTMRQVGIVPIEDDENEGVKQTPKNEIYYDDDGALKEENNDINSNYNKETEEDYTGRPLLFTFPGKANGRQDMYFDYKSMSIGPLSSSSSSTTTASLFDLPDGCHQKRCDTIIMTTPPPPLPPETETPSRAETKK